MSEEEKISTKELLRIIGMGVLIIGSAVAPGLPRAFLLFENKKKSLYFNKRYLSMQIKRLKNRELISIKEEGGQTSISLTEQGKQKVLRFNFDEMEITSRDRWDGKWRMIIFDIPNDLRKQRDMFRGKLKSLGFYRLQESVFIFPFPCEKEIEFIREYLEIGPHVLFLTFRELERKRLSLNRFNF